MKLQKKNFSNLGIQNFRTKFFKCSAKSLRQGDYVTIHFLWSNQLKKKKGSNIRLNVQTGIILRKLIKRNSMTVMLSVLFKFEKVKFYFIINSPQVILVKFVKKCLKKHLLKSLI